jgi:two-component system sensor histidine kinase MprB
MSLRARVASTAAAAVAIAVLLVSVLTYTATARRLEHQVDEDLDVAARSIMELQVQDASAGLSRLDAFRQLQRLSVLDQIDGRTSPPTDGDVSAVGRPSRGPRDDFRGAPDRQDRFLGPFGVGIVQLVGQDGISSTVGALALPVNDATRALASTGTGAAVRDTVQVQGRSVRVLAIGISEDQRSAALQVGVPIDDIVGALAALRGQLVLAGLLGVALAAALGAGVADRAVRPVRRLTVAAEEVGRTGDLATRIDVVGHDELGRLAASFNSMLAGLEQARSAQQQLVADASHELRTPLTSLRTNIEVLQLGGALSPEDQTALLVDVTSQIEEFGQLVDGMVELARGDTPARAPTRIDLGPLVSDVVDRAAVFAPHVAFDLTLDGSVVMAEQDRLARAVSNLIDNAVKHGGGTPIVVVVDRGVVRVRDHGPGIADEDVAHVFDRFYRAPDARARPGSGLGLSIVAQVATGLGGSYAARTHPDGGAEVELRLPWT